MGKKRFADTQTGGEGTTPQKGSEGVVNEEAKTGAEDVSIQKPIDQNESVNSTTSESKNVEVEPSPMKSDSEPMPVMDEGEPIPSAGVFSEKDLTLEREEPKMMIEDESSSLKLYPKEEQEKQDELESFSFEPFDNYVEGGEQEDDSEGFSFEPFDNFDDSDDEKPVQQPSFAQEPVLIHNLEDAISYKDKGYTVYLDGVPVNSSDGAIKNYLFTRSKRGIEMRLEPQSDDTNLQQAEEKPKKKSPEEIAPKGGQDFSGVKIFKYPARPNTFYTIQDGSWYRMSPGSEDWEAVTGDENIKSLNSWHGTDVKTISEVREESMSKAAAVAPPGIDVGAGYGTEKPSVTPEEMARFAEESDAEYQMKKQAESEARSLGDVSTMAGRAIEEQGLDIDERKAKDVSLYNPAEFSKTSEYVFDELTSGAKTMEFGEEDEFLPKADVRLVKDNMYTDMFGIQSLYGASPLKTSEAMKSYMSEKAEKAENDSKSRMENFSKKNLLEWANENDVSEQQMKELQDFQQEITKSISDGEQPIGFFGELEEDFNNYLKEVESQQEELKRVALSGESINDHLVTDKRLFMDQVKNSDFMSSRDQRVFYSTINLRDFVEQGISDGTIVRDELSGRIDISPNISSEERAYVESTLNEMMSSYQNAKVEGNKEMSTNLYNKRKELNKAKASLREVKKSNKTEELEHLNGVITGLEKEIQDITLNKQTVLMGDPKAIVSSVAKGGTSSQSRILKAIPADLTPKEKFDLYYKRLKDYTEKLAIENKIGTGTIDKMGDKFQDLLDVDFLGVSLSPEEEEFYKNYATLKKLAPLYAINEGGYTDETMGFWDSFFKSLVSTLFPLTSATNEIVPGISGTERAAEIKSTLNQLGMDASHMKREEIIQELSDRMSPPWWGTEGIGSMIGTTTAIISAMYATGAVSSGLLKGSRGVLRLVNGLDRTKDFTKGLNDIKRVEQVFSKTLNKTELGKFFAPVVQTSLQFELTGQVFGSLEKEMNWKSGFFGSLAAKSLQKAFSGLPTEKLVEHIYKFFGKSSTSAVDSMTKLGQNLNGAKNMHYMGIGEMIEETAQELTQLYNDELRTRGFWDEVSKLYVKNPSNLTQLLVSSYIMGAGMGMGNVDHQNDLISRMSDSEIEDANKIMSAWYTDNAIANGAADLEAGRLASIRESLTEETKDDTKDESGVSSEEQVGEKPVETDTEQRASEEEVSDGRVVQEEEQAEGEVTEETPEAKIISLADRIRSGKGALGGADMAAVLPIPGVAQAWDLALEGVARTVEGLETAVKKFRASEFYQENIKGNKEREAIVNEYLNNTKVAKQTNIIWAESLEGRANRPGVANTAMKKFKESKWFKDLSKNDPQTAKDVEGLIQEKVDRMNSRIEAETAGLEGKEKSAKIATIKSQNIPRYKRSHSQVKEDTKKATVKLKSVSKAFDDAYAAGEKAGKALGEKKRAEIEAKRQQVRDSVVDYARQSLPENFSGRRKFIGGVANKAATATTPKALDQAKESIDKAVEKHYEKERVELAEKLEKRLTSKSTYMKGKAEKQKGRISVDAQKELEKISEENQGQLKTKSYEELVEIEEQIEDIIQQGTRTVQEKEKKRKEIKRESRLGALEALVEVNNTEFDELSGGDIYSALAQDNRFVMFEGQVFTGKTELEKHLDESGRSINDTGSMDVYKTESDTKDAQQQYLNSRNKIQISQKWLSSQFRAPSNTLYNAVKRMSKGSIPFKRWMESNISEPTKKAFAERSKGRREMLNEIESNARRIFLGEQSGIKKSATPFGVINYLTEPTDISIGGRTEKINKDMAVDIYMMSKVYGEGENVMYVVGDRISYDKASTKAYSEESGAPIETIELPYDAKLVHQLSTEGKTETGLKVIQQIEDLVNSDAKLKEWSDYLFNDLYGSKAKDRGYEEMYEEIYDMRFKEGLYVPKMRNISNDTVQKVSSKDVRGTQTAISDNLKQKYGGNQGYNLTSGSYAKVLEYMNDMEHAKNFMPIAQKFNDILNPVTKSELIKKVGNEQVANLDVHINEILSDGSTKDNNNKAIEGLLKWKVVTTLAMNLGNVPKQMSSATHYIGAGLKDGVGPVKVLAQTGRILQATQYGITTGINKATGANTQPVFMTEEELDLLGSILKSHTVVSRVSGGDISMETRKMFNALKKSKSKSQRDAIVKLFMSPTVIGDIGGVLLGGVPYSFAIYKDARNQGLDHEPAKEKALQKFHDETHAAQQSTQDDQVSNFQRSAMNRFVTTFKTSQIAAMGKMFNGLDTLLDKAVIKAKIEGTLDKETKREINQAVWDTVYFPLSAMTFYAVANGVMAAYSDDEPRDKDGSPLYNPDGTKVESYSELIGYYGDTTAAGKARWDKNRGVFYDLIADAAQSDMQGLGIPGMVMDFATNILRGKEFFNNVPAMDIISDLSKTGAGIAETKMQGGDVFNLDPTKLFLNENDLGTDAYEDIIDLVGLGNFRKLSESWSELKEGKIGFGEFLRKESRGDEDIKPKYKLTPRQKGDMLYEWIFPEDFVESGMDEFAMERAGILDEISRELGFMPFESLKGNDPEMLKDQLTEPIDTTDEPGKKPRTKEEREYIEFQKARKNLKEMQKPSTGVVNILDEEESGGGVEWIEDEDDIQKVEWIDDE